MAKKAIAVAKMSKAEILAAIDGMTAPELVELIWAIKARYNVGLPPVVVVHFRSSPPPLSREQWEARIQADSRAAMGLAEMTPHRRGYRYHT